MMITAHLVWYVVACALFLPASLPNLVSDRVLWQAACPVFGSFSKSVSKNCFLLHFPAMLQCYWPLYVLPQLSFKVHFLLSPELFHQSCQKWQCQMLSLPSLLGYLLHPAKSWQALCHTQQNLLNPEEGFVGKKSSYVQILVWNMRNHITML